ncbi:hypothetical protein [Weizmannia sp. WK01]
MEKNAVNHRRQENG